MRFPPQSDGVGPKRFDGTSGASSAVNGVSAVANVLQAVVMIGLFTNGAPTSARHASDGWVRNSWINSEPFPSTVRPHATSTAGVTWLLSVQPGAPCSAPRAVLTRWGQRGLDRARVR